MQKTVIMRGFIVNTYADGSVVTGSATVSGTTYQPTMSDEQTEEMQCALVKLLRKSTSSLISTKSCLGCDPTGTSWNIS